MHLSYLDTRLIAATVSITDPCLNDHLIGAAKISQFPIGSEDDPGSNSNAASYRETFCRSVESPTVSQPRSLNNFMTERSTGSANS